MCVERDQRIAEMVRLKYSIAQIAAIENITPRSVQRAKERLKISRPMAEAFSAQELARAEELLDDGASYKDVAETLGRHPGTIAAHFPGRGWNREQVNEARLMSRKLARL